MKIIVDENIPRSTVLALREQGHDVRDIRGSELEGIADDTVWDLAVSHKRLLITTDKWVATKHDAAHPGVLVILLKQPNRKRIHDRVMLGFLRFEESQWPGLILIMRDSVQSLRKVNQIRENE